MRAVGIELDEAATADVLPRVLPLGWSKIGPNQFISQSQGLGVIISVELCADGKRWLHVSASRRSRLPSWDDMRWVKDFFVGKERKAISVLPAESEYVNDTPTVLHLWSCLDGDPLPDFRRLACGRLTL